MNTSAFAVKVTLLSLALGACGPEDSAPYLYPLTRFPEGVLQSRAQQIVVVQGRFRDPEGDVDVARVAITGPHTPPMSVEKGLQSMGRPVREGIATVGFSYVFLTPGTYTLAMTLVDKALNESNTQTLELEVK